MRRALGSALAAAAATAVLAAALAVALAAHRAVVGPLLHAVPPGEISVGAPVLALGPLRLAAGRRIDAALEARLAADPRVRRVSAEVPLRVPARVEGMLFGRVYTSDAAVIGTDAAMVGLPADVPFEAAPAEPVPVVFSAAFLDLYNVAFGPAHGLPGLSPSALIGRGFDLVIGESSIFGAPAAGHAIRRRARIVAFSDRPGLIGLAVPRAFVEEANRARGASTDPQRLHVIATDVEAAASLADDLRAEGYAVETHTEVGAAARRIARAGAAAILVVACGTGGVAAFGLGAAAAAAALERRREADVLHLVAWPRRRIVAALAGGIVLAGAVGASLGAAAGAWGAHRAWGRLAAPVVGSAAPADARRAAGLAAALVAAAGGASAFAAAGRVVPRWRRR